MFNDLLMGNHFPHSASRDSGILKVHDMSWHGSPLFMGLALRTSFRSGKFISFGLGRFSLYHFDTLFKLYFLILSGMPILSSWSYWTPLLIFFFSHILYPCVFSSIFLKISSTSPLSLLLFKSSYLVFPRAPFHLIVPFYYWYCPLLPLRILIIWRGAIFMFSCDHCIVSVISKLVFGFSFSYGRHSSEGRVILAVQSYLIARHYKAHWQPQNRWGLSGVDGTPGGLDINSSFW